MIQISKWIFFCASCVGVEFSHRTHPYHTHQPVLYEMAIRTTGPIIEFGCGYGSTDLLHEVCKADKRLLISLDDNLEWLNIFKEKYREDSEWHQFIFVEGKSLTNNDSPQHWVDFMNNSDLLKDCNFDICFVDQAPWEGRVETIKFMKDRAKYIILHDCDYFPTNGVFGTTLTPGDFDFSDIFRYFKVYFPLTPWPVWTGPPTLLGSQTESDLPEINFNDY